MRTVKAGGIYFLLAFAAGWLFGPIRELLVIPRVGRLAGYLLEAPLMLIVIIGAARWVVRRWGVARVTARTAMGLVALGLLLVAELGATRWVRGLSLTDYVSTFGSLPGVISLALFLLFAVMPVVVGGRPQGR